jgi:hypothetical protein
VLTLSNIIFISISQMLLREVAEHLEKEDDPALLQDVAFRERDALLLREECLRKYGRFEQMLAQVPLRPCRCTSCGRD